MAHRYDGLTQLHGTNAQSDGQKLQINCRGKSKNHYENKIKPGVLGGNHGGGLGGWHMHTTIYGAGTNTDLLYRTGSSTRRSEITPWENRTDRCVCRADSFAVTLKLT